ncbi:unnamed protein product [Vitrella brassicaformis CCMP3155]|uniref:Uncharacterized protein n=1 Tax=Vitrella brassicaformis (strain CCMP3155) TaxID=1169540 RepID=A0A0G4GYW1_VITBC|nr:unnamed protein product [Vitrella brassicaformis CCMP3155]|eukprot:CEM36390.1 unnamed protein product [Vitrella brassicaformis CCMP3155]
MVADGSGMWHSERHIAYSVRTSSLLRLVADLSVPAAMSRPREKRPPPKAFCCWYGGEVDEDEDEEVPSLPWQQERHDLTKTISHQHQVIAMMYRSLRSYGAEIEKLRDALAKSAGDHSTAMAQVGAISCPLQAAASAEGPSKRSEAHAANQWSDGGGRRTCSPTRFSQYCPTPHRTEEESATRSRIERPQLA